jgi:hypothetical protein
MDEKRGMESTKEPPQSFSMGLFIGGTNRNQPQSLEEEIASHDDRRDKKRSLMVP